MFDASKLNDPQFGSQFASDKREATSDGASPERTETRHAESRGPIRGQPVVPRLNPFCLFGGPASPMRMMFAPLEVALYLPAYAIDSFNGHKR